MKDYNGIYTQIIKWQKRSFVQKRDRERELITKEVLLIKRSFQSFAPCVQSFATSNDLHGMVNLATKQEGL